MAVFLVPCLFPLEEWYCQALSKIPFSWISNVPEVKFPSAGFQMYRKSFDLLSSGSLLVHAIIRV